MFSGNLEKKELNRLELEFLSAIDWNIYVSPDDYELTTQKLEWAVATKEVENRPGGKDVQKMIFHRLTQNITTYFSWIYLKRKCFAPVLFKNPGFKSMPCKVNFFTLLVYIFEFFIRN